MIQLTQWNSSKVKTTERVAHCKNCMFDESGEIGKYQFKRGEKRIVLSMSFGPSTRHISLCVSCALHEADQLAALANAIRLDASIITEKSTPKLKLIIGGAA